MKTQRNFLVALILTLVASFTLNANTVSENGKMIVKIEKQDVMSIAVQIANLQKQRTIVSVADLNGKTWFTKTVWKENGYAQKLNLTKLPSGTYVIAVKNKLETYTSAFSKTDFDVALFDVVEGNPSKGYAVLTNQNGLAGQSLITHINSANSESIDIHLANLENTKAEIQLHTLSGVAMLNDSVEGEIGYAKKYNLGGLKKGNYYFFIRTKGMSQIQFFSIQNDKVTLSERVTLKQNDLNVDLAVK